ncbi:MAG: ketoacyl-ACP synthase III, partial [Betaproteobacteria bacterium]
MIWSRIIGTGSYLPPKVVTNDDLAKQMDTTDEWIRTRTGIRQRHIAEPSQASSDLGVEASRAALAAARIIPQEIDLIIAATATPDYIFPSTACIMQAKLGMKGCAAFDIQAVCSGFVYALAIADKLIRSGQHRCALIVGTEVYSRILDWKDRGTAVLFGDGAGAVILRADSKPGIMASVLHADGSYVDILSVPGNVCGGKIVGSPFLQMDGQAVFKFAVKVLDEVARETLAQCGLAPSDIDWLIPHQANARILEATARKLRIDLSKLIVTVDIHGNTSAASVPLA